MNNSQIISELNKIVNVGASKHVFESKNDYKDYPCPKCGAISNADGSYCWQVKIQHLKEKLGV